ncbi:flagellar biosynthetic protein FliO [Timonella sp. A28]|uniref:flagellar biosynthetic protein FliO n=1 Tax=Timonella sp. A28 TaxID=3442640 RepID=UPI003EB78391
MIEPIIRAICALIIIVGLILWLGKAASGGGRVADFLQRLDRSQGAKTRTTGVRRQQPLPQQKKSIWNGQLFRGGARPKPVEPVLTVAARQQLFGRSAISVIDVDGRRLIVGVSDAGMTLLTQYEQPQDTLTEQNDVDVEEEPQPHLNSETTTVPESTPETSVDAVTDDAVTETLNFDDIFTHLTKARTDN